MATRPSSSARCAALAPQVDEVVVIANLPGSVGRLPPGVRVIENARPRPLAANVNAGIARHARAATSSSRTPTPSPSPVPSPTLVAFMDAHPRCGIAGPQIRWPDGTWQPSRRRFPTVSGTIVRRTPLRRLSPPYENQREHYLLDERPDRAGRRPTGCSARSCSSGARCSSEIGGWDAGYRHYVEDIDLCYRAMRAGWERWYVPAAIVTHAYAAVIDKKFLSRHTLWHLRGMARFARKHPEALFGSRG